MRKVVPPRTMKPPTHHSLQTPVCRGPFNPDKARMRRNLHTKSAACNGFDAVGGSVHPIEGKKKPSLWSNRTVLPLADRRGAYDIGRSDVSCLRSDGAEGFFLPLRTAIKPTLRFLNIVLCLVESTTFYRSTGAVDAGASRCAGHLWFALDLCFPTAERGVFLNLRRFFIDGR